MFFLNSHSDLFVYTNLSEFAERRHHWTHSQQAQRLLLCKYSFHSLIQKIYWA